MKPIGHRIVRLDEVDSTNTLALEDESYLENHGVVIIARHQTAGRGRMGRKYASVPGAQLQFSVVVHPNLPTEEVALSALIVGLAVAEAIEEIAGLQSKLKWPNDVYLGRRKVCGILVEMKHGSDGRPRLVVGIGINCRGKPADFPSELRERLTTIAYEKGAPVDKEALFHAVLTRLDVNFRLWESGGKTELLDQWRRRAHLAGRAVRYSVGQEWLMGRAESISDEGHLIIVPAGGGRHVQSSGEVEWLD